jgi:hypothetical protein
MAQKTTLDLFQGATYIVPFQCEIDEAVPDYTGWVIKFIVKKRLTDANDDALINQTVSPDPLSGEATITLTDEMTAAYPVGTYIYQGVVIDSDGNVAKTELGTFVVKDTAYKGAIA